MTKRSICFSHGKESGPWGTKIKALAGLASDAGWEVDSLDYRGMDDPQDRVNRLLAWCNETEYPYALVGSSMGGHVAAAATALAEPLGLFLMAPAFFMPGYEAFTPACPDCPVTIVHGWHDEIVPWEHSARFSESGGASVILLDSDHRLTNVLDDVGRYFQFFLAKLVKEINDDQQ
jgi:alpha-beta hydrolase superfamily lysophospholipase